MARSSCASVVLKKQFQLQLNYTVPKYANAISYLVIF